MARKRSGGSRRPRQIPGSERSYYEYLHSAPALPITRTELVRLLRGGEDTYLELKVRFSNVEKLTAEIIALANTDGGAIIFGVNDQLRVEGVDDPESVEKELRELCAHQIQPPVFPYINKVAFDNGRRVVILEVDTEDRPHRTLDDRFYIREGSSKRETTREELSRLYQETYQTRFEQVPVFQSWIEQDIDESLFWSYVRGVAPGYWGESTRGFPTDHALGEMGLVVKLGEELIPTVGGLLLFGLNERVAELIPRASIHLTRYSGNDTGAPVIERVELRGNLLRLFDGALSFISRYADLWDSRPQRRSLDERAGLNGMAGADLTGGAAAEAGAADAFLHSRANYHRGAIIEALTNFIAHRDWSPRERPARINIFDESIEFINPAITPELPIVSLRYGVAIAPNPRLKSILTNRHYGIPSTSGGVPMLISEAKAFARRAPEGPAIAGGEFRLKIFGLC